MNLRALSSSIFHFMGLYLNTQVPKSVTRGRKEWFQAGKDHRAPHKCITKVPPRT